MRSKRLIKKLSKKLAPLFDDVWVCEDREELYYNGDFYYHVTAKGIPHVGGGLDYWGEAEDYYTVLEAAENLFWSWQSFCGCEICQDSFDPARNGKDCGITAKRKQLKPVFKNILAAVKSELER